MLDIFNGTNQDDGWKSIKNLARVEAPIPNRDPIGNLYGVVIRLGLILIILLMGG